jgi:hypothetical protein
MYRDTKAYCLTFATGADAENMMLCCDGRSLKAEMLKICVYWHAGKPLYAIPMQIDKAGVCRIYTGLGVFVRTFAYQFNEVLWLYFLKSARSAAFWRLYWFDECGFVESFATEVCHKKYTLVQPIEQYSFMYSLLNVRTIL